jgi:ADP-ribose pyrophosphatase
MSDEIVRLNLDRGDSVAALIHLKAEGCFLFTEQFRFATCDRGPGWLLEVPAGMRDGDEEPVLAMKREVLEELGIHVNGPMQHLSTFYLSPGGSSERLYLYYASVEAVDKVEEGGGVKHEGEDIRMVTLPVADALQLARDGKIADAKTLIALQWFDLHQASLC